MRYMATAFLLIIIASAAFAQATGPQLSFAQAEPEALSLGIMADGAVIPESPPSTESAPEDKADAEVNVTVSEAEHIEHFSMRRPSELGPVETEAVNNKPVEQGPPVVRKSGRPDKIAMLADLEKKDQSPAAGGSSVTAKTVLSTILKLAVVLVLAYLTILVLKWLSVKKDAPPESQGDFRVKDTLRLSPTGTLHLVDVKGKTLLIGCSSGQVNLIREFDEIEQVEAKSDGHFAQYLERYSQTSRKHGAAGRVAGLLRDCTTYLRERRNKVGGDGR